MRWPKVTVPFPGPRARAVIELDRSRISPSLTRLYPFVADSGEGCWLRDVDGNTFLDFTSGIAVASTGHCHPRVVEAIERQARKLTHFSLADFYHAPAAELAAVLTQLFPGGGPARVFFGNSGAESVECALKLARHHTHRPKIVAFHGAFHGRTTGALSLSDSKPLHKKGFGPLLDGVFHIPYSLEGLEYLEKTLFRSILPPEKIAAIFFEPIQGERGVIMPEDGFLPGLRRICDEHGILLVADEVQTGMGRTGKMFACEHWGVVPDILCLAKGIASGMPLGAVLARADVMDWPPGTHASTFGGNPVSCAAALATIELLRGALVENAESMGGMLIDRLRDTAARHPLIREIRGAGLLVGIELMIRGKPAVAERDELLLHALEHGLLLLGGGDSVVRMVPPLIVNPAEIQAATDLFETALDETLHHRKAA